MSFGKPETEEEIVKYIDHMKRVYDHFLTFIDDTDPISEEDFTALLKIIDQYNIVRNKELFNHFIDLLIDVANNHHRQTGFFSKIERILIKFQSNLQENNTNEEIYKQFENSKYLLLFLIKEKIITIDENIKKIIKNKMNEFCEDFFLLEIPKEEAKEETLRYYMDNLKEYEEKRREGENDSYICSLIRTDSIEEFVSFVTRTNTSLSSIIKPSIFETNLLLIENEPTLIEYAAFFGSIQIFEYLYFNNVEVTDSIWKYAIHSNNSDFIRNHIENKDIIIKSGTKENILKECIICHHNDIGRYIQDNLFNDYETPILSEKNTFNERIFETILSYHNYSFFPDEFNQTFSIYYFYKYHYIDIVNLLIQSQEENIKQKISHYISKF